MKKPLSLNLFKMDSHTFHQLRYKILSLVTGVMTVGLIPFFLNEVTQGYYFTFASLLSAQIFFELGLNQVVVQLVGHEYANLKRVQGNLVENKYGNLSRLSSIYKFLKKWYFFASILFCCALTFLGTYLFGRADELPFSEWFYPWIALIAITSANLYVNMLSAIIEGFGKVDKVAQWRFRGTVIGLILFTLILISGYSLFALSAIPLCQLISIIILKNIDGTFFQLRKARSASSFSWKKEIFPFQWRVAATWMAGYFSLYLFTPVTFETFGAVEAGRIGLAFAIFNAVFGISSTWVSAKFPKFGHLISTGQKDSLRNTFKIAAIKSQITITFAIISGIIIFLIFESVNSDLLSRLPTFFQFVLIASVTFINTYINSIATFMRAHKEEPLLVISIVQAILMIIVLLNAELGIIFLLIGYNFINIFVVAIWATVKFKEYYYA